MGKYELDGRKLAKCSVWIGEMRIRRKKVWQVFRVDRENENLTEGSLASVPRGLRKYEFDGRKQVKCSV